jgi:hypothetical protein
VIMRFNLLRVMIMSCKMFMSVLLGSLLMTVVGLTPAVAAGPGLMGRMVTEPAVFNANDSDPNDSFIPGLDPPVDSYRVFVTNSSGQALTGAVPVVVKFTSIPAGFTPTRIDGLDLTSGEGEKVSSRSGWSCAVEELKCVYSGEMPVGDVLEVELGGETAPAAEGMLLAKASIEGGGVGFSNRSVSATAEAGTEALRNLRFGVSEFDLSPLGEQGAVEAQAGGRLTELEVGFQINTEFDEAGSEPYGAPQGDAVALKNVAVDLPPGLVGYAQSLPKCSIQDLTYKQESKSTLCPSASRIGSVILERGSGSAVSSIGGIAGLGPEASFIYNLQPEPDYPVEFGFMYESFPITMYGRLVRTGSGYAVQVTTAGLPRAYEFTGAMISIWGNPGTRDASGIATAFLRNPTSCEPNPPDARLELESWYETGRRPFKEIPIYPEGITGCNLLQFGYIGRTPSIEATPVGSSARMTDTPTGYAVALKVPQAPSVMGAPATPDLRDATVTLPAGVALSPPSGQGLQGCSTAQFHDEPAASEPNEPVVTTAAACPEASEVGDVELRTPLLEEAVQPLKGQVYLALPKCGPCSAADAQEGRLLHLYVQVEGPPGVDGHPDFYLKLTGTGRLNQETGQITTTFANNPQLPFTEFKLTFHGGPRAPLANPQACGTFTTTSVLEPWSAPETPDATPPFPVTINEGCTSMFAPSFTAGTTTPLAGEYSPFVLTLSRQDREQDIAGLSTTLPVGLLAAISHVALCPEPQASLGQCPEGSRIGSVRVAAGAGSEPLWETGSAYLTGPYGGGPFGLSVVVPAVAGPFNLGNVVVQAGIHIDPHTAAVTVISNPFPQLVDGIPLRMKTVNITLDRSEFTINPTSCTPKEITGTVTSAQGAQVAVSSPFDVAGCQDLPFKPTFSASTAGKTSKANGASLTVKVTSGTGQANIGEVAVDLPKQLPSRLTTLQKACTEAQFNTNPAGCPAASLVGTAVAHTPILNNPLTGPAYLVSHGGAAFPDLEILLQGEGVVLDLDGNTNIKKGITSSTFNSVPDAPISTFEVTLPEGAHSALATDIPAKAKGSLCGQSLKMPTTIVGQNGAQITQSTKIGVTGCAKAKPKKKPKHKKKQKAKGHHHGGRGSKGKGKK